MTFKEGDQVVCTRSEKYKFTDVGVPCVVQLYHEEDYCDCDSDEIDEGNCPHDCDTYMVVKIVNPPKPEMINEFMVDPDDFAYVPTQEQRDGLSELLDSLAK